MSLLRQDVRLPESSIHDFGRDMVVALQYLHANSIIYCDIKVCVQQAEAAVVASVGSCVVRSRLAHDHVRMCQQSLSILCKSCTHVPL